MIHNFAEKNEEFMVEFGKILLKHHRDMARVSATIEGGCDQAALNFARYLRAARANASLSPEELAQQADIPAPVIYALERGLIFSKHIKAEHLLSLAEVLNEDINIFALLLNCDIPQPGLAGIPVKAQNNWQAAVAYLGSTLGALLVTALMLIALFGSSLLMQHPDTWPFSALPASQLTAETSPISILSLILVLLLLLLWLAIKNDDLPSWMTAITLKQKRKLVYTPFLLLILIFVTHLPIVEPDFDGARSIIVTDIAHNRDLELLATPTFDNHDTITWWKNKKLFINYYKKLKNNTPEKSSLNIYEKNHYLDVISAGVAWWKKNPAIIYVDAAGANDASSWTDTYTDHLNPSNDMDAEETTIIGLDDLAISITDMPDPVNANDVLTYTLSIANLGPSKAEPVSVSATLPDDVTFISVDDSSTWACAHDNGMVTCQRGRLGDRSINDLRDSVDETIWEKNAATWLPYFVPVLAAILFAVISSVMLYDGRIILSLKSGRLGMGSREGTLSG